MPCIKLQGFLFILKTLYAKGYIMSIKAENTVTQSDINALIKCSGSKTRTILIVLSLTFVMFLIFCMIVGSTGRNFGYCIAGLIWCGLVYSYMFLLNPRLVYRSFCRRYGREAIVNYKFKNGKLSVRIENSGGNLDKSKQIEDMFRAYETDDYYFLYIKRNETFILRKSGFTEGTPKELSEELMKKMGNRYIRKVTSDA